MGRLFSFWFDTAYDTIVYYESEGVIAMSQWEKLLSRICTLPKDVRLSELRKVLESYGYEARKPSSGSSH